MSGYISRWQGKSIAKNIQMAGAWPAISTVLVTAEFTSGLKNVLKQTEGLLFLYESEISALNNPSFGKKEDAAMQFDDDEEIVDLICNERPRSSNSDKHSNDDNISESDILVSGVIPSVAPHVGF